MVDIKNLDIIESVYGLHIETEVLIDLFMLSHRVMINESLFEDINFNYDALRLDVTSKQGEYATCDWYLENVEGVLNYYTEPMAYVKYTDEEGSVDCEIKFINKDMYDDMIRLFYGFAVDQYLNSK